MRGRHKWVFGLMIRCKRLAMPWQQQSCSVSHKAGLLLFVVQEITAGMGLFWRALCSNEAGISRWRAPMAAGHLIHRPVSMLVAGRSRYSHLGSYALRVARLTMM